MISKSQNEMINNSNFIILGCGYVGTYYLQKYPQSYFTNREIKLSQSQNLNQIYFDLKNKDSWKNIPNSKNVLWTFSAAINEIEIQQALDFYDSNLKNKNVIILSSTSAYRVDYENEIINENKQLLLNIPRFNAEENLRIKGASIIHLSGIIGPNRTPLNWYKKNLVKYEENILNYIHVSDIVYFIKKLFENFMPSQRFNLTSQDYQTHKLIISKLIKLGALEKNFCITNQEKIKHSKKISSDKILNYLKEESYIFKKYPEDFEF